MEINQLKLFFIFPTFQFCVFPRKKKIYLNDLIKSTLQIAFVAKSSSNKKSRRFYERRNAFHGFYDV